MRLKNLTPFTVILLLALIFYSKPVRGLKCEDLSELEKYCQQVSKEECKKVLEDCQKHFEVEITNIEAEMEKTSYKKSSLAQEIKKLENEIQKLEKLAKQNEISIFQTKLSIQTTENEINKKNSEIEETRERVKEILKTIYRIDKISGIELLVSYPSISQLFMDQMLLESLEMRVKYNLEKLRGLKKGFEEYKAQLEREKDDLEHQLKIQLLQKTETEDKKKERHNLLKITEKEYAEQLKKKENFSALAQEIRKRIFQLVGVPRSPTFGEAYQIAKWVNSLTGVRPAFLLAILQQESAIGRNVGQCYLKNPQDGSGVVISTGERVERVMNPWRDVPLFLEIVKKLGRDPFSTPVSCPMEFGWGGAMGPAQFIPSTWNLYEAKISQILGKPADPWEIKDSFLAAGVYLADIGGNSLSGERKAALGYFGGNYPWYANSVLSIAAGFEEDIKVLEGKKASFLFQRLLALISPPSLLSRL